jgi:hypothetical protein
MERLGVHLDWADERLHRAPGMLILMCGFSGSGKSYVAQRLAPQLPAVRIRSDVLRKTRAGLAPEAHSNSPVDGGLYTPGDTQAVYADMLQLSEKLARAGDDVLVDATFLTRPSRAAFQALATALGTGCAIVHCQAPRATLEARIRDRERKGEDASEAGLEVLQRQSSGLEPIGSDELTITVNTHTPLDIAGLVRRLRAARA